MARALREVGFKDVEVSFEWILLDGVHYKVDKVLVDWQRDAIDDGGSMTPIRMKLDLDQGRLSFWRIYDPTTRWERGNHGGGEGKPYLRRGPRRRV